MNPAANLATARRLEPIRPSAITQIAEKARELGSKGRRICNLSVGEPDFPTDPHVIQAAIEAMRRGETTYPRTQGSLALIEAIASRVEADYGLSVDGSRIMVANGAKQVLFNALMATMNDGDEMIVPAPYWTSYPDILSMAGGVGVITPALADGSLLPDVAAMEAAITHRTRWILLNSPSNPSGMVFPERIMQAIFGVMRRHERILLMCDEIYDKIVFDGLAFRSALVQAPDLAERILVINGVSKTYAMTGWRIGYGIGSRALISAMTLVQGQSTSGACSIAQAGAAAALGGPQAPVAERRRIYEARRDLVVGELTGACGLPTVTPGGAFYAMPRIAGYLGRTHPRCGRIADDVAFCKALLDVAQVATVPGSAFGAPGYARLSFATSETVLREGISRLAEFLADCR